MASRVHGPASGAGSAPQLVASYMFAHISTSLSRRSTVPGEQYNAMPAVWVYADGRLSFAVSTSSNPNVWTYSQTSLSVGQWYFVAITVSQSQSTAEIRVKTVDLSVQTLACMYWTSGATLTTDSSSALYISERTSGTAYVLVRPAFVGQVRQLTFFTSVLTDIDIVTYLNLCNSMAFPPPSPGMQSQAHVLVDGPISAGAGRVVSLSSQPAGIPWLSTGTCCVSCCTAATVTTC